MNIVRGVKLLIAFVLVFGLYACGRGEPEPMSLEVVPTSIEGDFFIAEFDMEEVRLVLTMDDGSEEIIHLDESMLSDEDIQKLGTTGIHEITVFYEDLTVDITLRLVDDLTVRLMAIYDLATEADAFDGTYEEWLESVRGPKGEDGREVRLRVAEQHIQWQYEGDEDWENLLALAALMGPAGDDGVDGVDGREILLQVGDTHIQWQYDTDDVWHDLIAIDILIGPRGERGEAGEDGREVTLRLEDDYLQWQYEGESDWQDLLSLDTLTRGPQGEDGADGREVDFRVAQDHIQWRYEGETNWRNLVALSTLVGPPGPQGTAGEDGQDGADGEDGREIEFHVSATHIQWRYDTETTWWNLISLDLLMGPRGDQGEPGEDGEDGREVLFRIDAGFLQWKHEGDSDWQDLLELASLTKGDPGEDGRDGREVVMQVGDGHIQWKYDGDAEWQDLISLDLLMGPQGEAGEDGEDGREVVLRVADDYIQWRYEDDEEWTDLIEIASLIGSPGDQGVSIVDTEINEYGELIITFSDDTIQNLGQILRVYTVLFKDYNGYVLDTQLLTHGQDASPPADPEREGHIFTGWSADHTDVTEDLAIRAEYETLTYTVQFESNGGTPIDALADVKHGSTLELPVPEKYRHGFIGWYLGDDANAEPFYGTSYVTGNTTLYARWEYKAHRLDFVVLRQPYEGGYGVQLRPDEYIVDVSISNEHSGALTSHDRLLMWGNNTRGQLGDGTAERRITPVDITDRFNLHAGETIIRISLNIGTSMALTSDARLFTWGSYETLGDGSPAMRNVPDDITDQFGLANEEHIVAISTGYRHGSALTSEGRLFMWGWNYYGALGDGTTQRRLTPVDITDQFAFGEGETITDISMNSHSSSVLTSEGRLFTWGANNVGQLGDGTKDDRHVPTDITDQFDLAEHETIIMHNMGGAHAAAWTSEGRLFMWGYNANSQLGQGGGTHQYKQVDISAYLSLEEEETLIDIALGATSSTVLTSTGRVFAWGQRMVSDTGVSQDEPYPFIATPPIAREDGDVIITISAGAEFGGGEVRENMAFLTDNGHLYMWGINWAGQLGDGSIGRSTDAVRTFAQVRTTRTAYYNHGDVVDIFMPEKEGHIVSEWYLDPELTTPSGFLDGDPMVQEDLTLYGRWLTEYTGILSACIQDRFCIMKTDQGPIGLPDTHFFDFLLDIDIGDKIRVYGVAEPYRNIHQIPQPIFDGIISVDNPLPDPVCLEAFDFDDFDALSPYFGHRVALSGFLVMKVEELLLPGFLDTYDIRVHLLSPFTGQEIMVYHDAFLTDEATAETLLALEYGDLVDLHGAVLKWRDGAAAPRLFFTPETEIVESSQSYDFTPYLEVEDEADIKISMESEHQITWTVHDDRWADVIFDSSDETVAIVSENGLITPVNPGYTSITIALLIDPSVHVTMEVHVYEPE